MMDELMINEEMIQIKMIAENTETGEVQVISNYIPKFLHEKYKEVYFKNVSKNGNAKNVKSKLYHITPKSNLDSIIENGIKCGNDGCVFLTVKSKIDKVKETLKHYYPDVELIILEVPTSTLLSYRLYNGHKNGEYEYFDNIYKYTLINE